MIATAAPVAVSCAGVTKTYGAGQSRVTALRGIDLEVREGELLMLVGPSGCGKTTLISVIAGILDHDDGECLVFGENLRALPQARRTAFRGERIGFVFQQFNLIPTLTIAENVAVPLLIQGRTWRSSIAQAREFLDRVGIGDRWAALPSKLSGGQQQRVAIARSLVHGPRLIVCDEPTSSLDHETGHKVMELMKEVAAGHDRALVVVTHDARIFEFADRIARMDDGKITGLTDRRNKEPER
ncbi:MAG: ABC transporter ATP-binding protein [Planctomycetia bacterium]|nr:ABC transporter ATP-binding protein [Planctomycetia bacterium]